MKVLRTLVFASVAAASLGLPGSVALTGERDHDRAREAVASGAALPLADILGKVRTALNGEIVGVEFERDHGRWVYDFKVVSSDGRLARIHVDAQSAEIISRDER